MSKNNFTKTMKLEEESPSSIKTANVNSTKDTIPKTKMEALINLASSMSFKEEESQVPDSEINEEIQLLVAVAVISEDEIIVRSTLSVILKYYQEHPELLNEKFPLDPAKPEEQRIYGSILHAILYARREDLVLDFLNSLFSITNNVTGRSIINVNSISEDITKHTPLYYALLAEKYMIAKFLVEHRATINIGNAYGALYHTSEEYLLNNVDVEEVRGIVAVLKNINFADNKRKSAKQQFDIFQDKFKYNERKYNISKFAKKDVYKDGRIIFETIQEANSEGPEIKYIHDKVGGNKGLIVDNKILIPSDAMLLHTKKKVEDSNPENLPDILKQSKLLNLSEITDQNTEYERSQGLK